MTETKVYTAEEQAKKRAEFEAIGKVAKRAWAIPDLRNIYADYMSLVMDIEAVNDKTPLDFEGLMNTDEGNFRHDISGIAFNLNRETKELENSFSPRHTKH